MSTLIKALVDIIAALLNIGISPLDLLMLSWMLHSPCGMQNVQPEKLFTRERAVQQLLGIIDSTSMQDNGRYIAWDGQDIPW